MSVIAAHLGIDLRNISSEGSDLLPKGNIGIEIELEGGDEDDFPQVRGWELKPDGSLRDGMEYVFYGPQSGTEAHTSIQRMAEAMEQFDPRPTFRCSTHIHLDVRDLSWNQWERLVMLYMVYEDVFFDHAQDYRRMSNFCVPFMNNDYLCNLFGNILRVPDEYKLSHCREWPKYSALNLQTTGSFGTVEFRGSHAVWTEPDLMGLAQRMLHLKRYVLEDNSENHFAFINKAQEDGLEVVFPTGIREGYTMTPGAMDLGASAAMGSLMASVAPVVPREIPSGMWDTPPVAHDPIRAIRSSFGVVGRRAIAYNLDALRALNIQPPNGQATLVNGLHLLSSLNRLEGVNVTLSQLLTTASYGRIPRAHLEFLRANLNTINADVGLSLTTDKLS